MRMYLGLSGAAVINVRLPNWVFGDKLLWQITSLISPGYMILPMPLISGCRMANKPVPEESLMWRSGIRWLKRTGTVAGQILYE